MTTTQMIFTAGGSAFSLLLVIIGWFIVRSFNTQDNTNNRLNKTIEKLSDSMTGLSGIVLKYEERHVQLRKEFDEHKDEHKKTA